MKNVPALVGSSIGVLGLAFGLWQYAEGRAIERGEYQALLRQLTQQVSRFERMLDDQQEITVDLRARVGDLERSTRYLHGEIPSR